MVEVLNWTLEHKGEALLMSVLSWLYIASLIHVWKQKDDDDGD